MGGVILLSNEEQRSLGYWIGKGVWVRTFNIRGRVKSNSAAITTLNCLIVSLTPCKVSEPLPGGLGVLVARYFGRRGLCEVMRH